MRSSERNSMRGCLLAALVVVCGAGVLVPFGAARHVLAAAQQPQVAPLALSGNIPNGVLNEAYSGSLQASGGTAPYAFVEGGNLPSGLAWSVTGSVLALSGTPQTQGSYELQVSVADALGQKLTRSFTLSTLLIHPHDGNPQTVTDTESLTTTDSVSIAFPVLVNVAEPLQIADAPSLPQPVLVNVAESLHISDANQPAISYPPLGIQASPAVSATGTVGFPFSNISFNVTGGSGKATMSHSGAVRPGLTLSTVGALGSLSGTPALPGTYTFSVKVTDDHLGTTASQTYTVVVAMPHYDLSPGSFPVATVAKPYGPVTFSIVGQPTGYTLTMRGALPPGLTYTASGETVTISGTPTPVSPSLQTYGPFNFDLTDTYGNVETLGPIGLDVEPAPLATFASSITPAASLYTDQITLTLAGTGNYSAPTGIFSLSMDGGAAKNYPLTNGTVVLPLGRLAPGSHTLDYTYSGDAQYPATDQTYNFTVAYPPYYLTGTVSGVLQNAGFYDVVDPSDNIYIADTDNNVIRKYDLSGNLTVVPSTGLRQPRSMAFDGVGNLYIADSVNNRIVVLAPNGTQTVLPGLTINFPSGIAFDRTYKNLWITDQNNYQVLQYNMSTQTVTSTVTGFYNVPDAVAVAADGTVYVGTVESYGNGGIYSFTPGATTAVALPYSQFSGVGCLVFDRFGNLYISDRDGNNLFRRDSSGNVIQLATQISAGIALDSQGTVWLANGGLSKFVPGPAGYAGVSNSYEGAYGGTFGGTFRAFFHSPTGTTLAALAVPANNAYQAAYGVTASDSFAFSDIGRGPIYPGLQNGSVTATFSDGTVLKVPLYGSAFNTQLAISPGIVSQTTTNATSYGGATTDANGNIYFSDTAANKVYEVFQGIVTAVPVTGLNAPTQLAVDGNGSVYVLDSGTSRILKYNNTGTLANNTTTVTFDLSAQSALASLTAFALDGATDLYLAGANNNGQGNSFGNGLIQELNALGTYSTFSAGLVAVPTALGLDSNSQLYSGDATGLLTKFTKVGALGALAKNLGSITSMAIEPSGTVYMTTTGSPALSVVSPQGVVSSYSIAGVTNAVVMTEDKLGTLTVADGASGLLVTDVRDPNLLSPNPNQSVNVGFNFPATVVGSVSPVQSYTLSNIGTTEDAYGASGLTLQGLPNLGDFPQAPSTTCVAGTTNLVAGASCVLAFTFNPTTPGNYNEIDHIQYSTEHNGSSYSLLGPTFTSTAISQFPVMSLSASSLSFGNVVVGSSSTTQNVTVANNGAATLHFTSININGGGFTQTNNCGTTLAPFASCTVVVTFAPTSATDYSGAQLNFITDGGGNGNRNVQAIYLAGSGVAATVPGAPTIGVATAGNAAASISFTAPTLNGGLTITSYTVTSSPGGITATSSSSPITVTGLTNGTAYTFTVKATNANGTGPASAPSNSVTPAVQKPPVIVDVVVMHKSAPLSVFPTTGSSAGTGSSGGGIGAAIDSSGSILSIDSAGASLTKFTDAGAVSGTLSGGGLNAATALAVDGNSNVWVANGNGTLSVFTSSGAPVSAIPLAAAGNMSQPARVNIDASGSVWVANTGNNTVTEIVGAASPSPVLVNAVISATPGTKP